MSLFLQSSEIIDADIPHSSGTMLVVVSLSAVERILLRVLRNPAAVKAAMSLIRAHAMPLPVAPDAPGMPQAPQATPEQIANDDVSRAYLSVLKKRERRLIALVLEGKDNVQIAKATGSSLQYVKNQLRHLYKKVDCCDRTQLAIFVLKHPMLADEIMKAHPSDAHTTASNLSEQGALGCS